MSRELGDPTLVFRHLDDSVKRGGFSSRNQEIDRWFTRAALKAHREGSVVVTCASRPSQPDRPIGFYAIATVAEEVARLPGVPPRHRLRGADHFSALQLVWLAVDHRFQGSGFGTRLMGEVVKTFAAVGPRIGLPALIVMPHSDNYERLTRFYKDLGFREYIGGGTMFLPLQLALAAHAQQDDSGAPD